MHQISRFAAAVLLVLAPAACSHGDAPPGAANCSVGPGKVRDLLDDATKPAHVTLKQIDKEVCAPDWVFARATFTQADGTPTEPTGFLFHRDGTTWQMLYQGTGPLDPGDPRCAQVPAQIKQDPAFGAVCPS